MITQHNPRPFTIMVRTLATDAEKRVNGRYSVDLEALEGWYATGPGWKFWAGELVVDVVQDPIVIFHGLERDNYNDAFGYACDLPFRYDDDGNKQRLKPGWVMIAFAVISNDELVFFDWDFRPGDQKRRGFPADWEADFGEPLWVKQ